ncbi:MULTISPECIES: hypothetical protein [unclassified Ensifer]|uniref:hypothetical protein n=1 Tax=unclassified Ensifer TaxID=2633371 RepID=UPI0007159CE0|nr:MULTISPECIES: hypothetical protein [unclassified Ensifer]KQX55448.1 hypothetical protein ASD49_25165 [Ensifer sp. Root1298]KQX90940.1 hypothetical protein ASD41_23855 [Ensifer sp. Root1312]KRC25784.1 hypothetical protein ASE29_22315 [Ensifer sp. Root74]KRD73664.1 hypothetical protein ASE71_19640 [Ensifer sp. Root954]
MWPRILAGGLVLAGIVWLVAEIREDGARSVITKIERQNNEAASRAHSKRIDYDSCLDAGGLWNFRAGECDGP